MALLQPEQIKTVSNNLDKMENVQEAFDYLSRTFDLKKTKINGIIVGPKFKEGMISALKLLQPPLK